MITIPYTPEQNGTVERDNRTIVEAARTQLHAHSLYKRLWTEAVNASVYVLNRTGTSTIKNKTPYQLWFDKDANIDKIKEFGSTVYVHIPKVKRKKFDKKAIKCVLVGYCDNGYRVYNSQTNKIIVSRDVVFGKYEKNTSNFVESVKNSKEKSTKVTNENVKSIEVSNKFNNDEDGVIFYFPEENKKEGENNEEIELNLNESATNEKETIVSDSNQSELNANSNNQVETARNSNRSESNDDNGTELLNNSKESELNDSNNSGNNVTVINISSSDDSMSAD